MHSPAEKSGPRAGDPARRQHVWRRAATSILARREASIVIAGILLVIYFQSTTGVFLSQGNISTLGQYASATAILAAGQVLVLVSGELDLSVGMVYAMAPFLMFLAHGAGLPTVVAIILALLGCAVVGLLNGLITELLRIHSFVTTMGMLFLLNGFTLTISGGYPVQPHTGDLVAAIFGGNALAQFGWAIAIALAFQFVLVRTRWGLHTIAVGGNLTGATEAGVKVKFVKIRNFTVCSMLAGFAGILDSFHIGSITPLAGGTQIMFMCIASAVIGGTLLAGGVGTIIGAFFGALVIGILKDGFTLAGVSAYTFDMILGAAILITMIVNVHIGRFKLFGGQ
ncbi:ABC transporter permease [Salinisphaera sp.]|uniref:ABC transporter permease n=1 Tax=Salinisphaera sp. TaxID=1914330 RepID=UPI002D78D298|nr:ABC transporter permease [Salinisphaera sp.]HET7313542.1 ABC transporter permease [Salinisphaera sp.]